MKPWRVYRQVAKDFYLPEAYIMCFIWRCRGPENDVHTRAARLRLNLFSKDIGAF